MPIAFSCDCGKRFTVSDEYAGKRTKCPGCGSALTVPTPEAPGAPEVSKEESEEEKAYRALAEAPDEEPAPRTPPVQSGSWAADPPRRVKVDAAPEEQPSKPKKPPKFRKPSAEEREARKSREPRQHDPERARKILYMIGGAVMILGGIGLVFLSFEGGSIRGGVFGGMLAFGGIGTFFQGVTGEFDDE
jgi:hypothetical protein